MKSMAISFGFTSVNAGQRTSDNTPKFIATSTPGNFRITGPVSKTLGISAGEYIHFVSNIDGIDAAIREKNENLVKYCEENGLDINTPAALVAIHKEFDRWGIVKGIPALDQYGNVLTIKERLSKVDKIKFAEANFDNMLESALAEDSGIEDDVRAALTRAGATHEELVSILSQFVKGRELPKFKGSKTASASNLTGIGVTLNFTDANVWKQMKSDLGDTADKVNRVFEVDIENITPALIDNGATKVEVSMLLLGEYTDEKPMDRSKSEDSDENAE